MITALDNEVQSLKSFIDSAHVHHDSETVKELGRVTGELEMVRRRMREMHEQQVDEYTHTYVFMYHSTLHSFFLLFSMYMLRLYTYRILTPAHTLCTHMCIHMLE